MRRLCLLICLGCAAAFEVHAHGVHVFATANAGQIEGMCYFSGGDPVRNAVVFVQDADGVALGEAKTDEAGAFVFTPAGAFDHVFVLDLPDGHRDSFILPAGELPGAGVEASPPPKPNAEQATPTPAVEEDDLTALIEAAVSREVAPLRRQIDAYQHAVRVHDVIGGIGYVVGIFGFVFWMKSRNGKKRTP